MILVEWVRSMRHGRGKKDIGRLRSELLRSKVLPRLFQDAVRKCVIAWKGSDWRTRHRKLRLLRRGACEGIGALLWGARGEAREPLLAMLKEVAGGHGGLERRGRVVARRDPLFRLAFKVEASAELRELLDRSADRAEVVALLRGLFPSYRVNAMARATSEVIDLLGAEACFDLLDWDEIQTIDHLRHLVPSLPARMRTRVLDRALIEQQRVGDGTSLATLLMCAPWMNVAQAAEGYAQLIEEDGAGEPASLLGNLLSEHGQLDWSVPLLQKLGGDEVLVAAGREVVGAWTRVVRELGARQDR